MQYIAEHVVNSLHEYGWALVDHFLGDPHCMAVRRELEQLYARHLFADGQLMESREGSSAKSIRSDEIFW